MFMRRGSYVPMFVRVNTVKIWNIFEFLNGMQSRKRFSTEHHRLGIIILLDVGYFVTMVSETFLHAHAGDDRVHPTPFASRANKSISARMGWLAWATLVGFYLFRQFRYLALVNSNASYYRSLYLDLITDLPSIRGNVRADTPQLIPNVTTVQDSDATMISFVLHTPTTNAAMNSTSKWKNAIQTDDGNLQIEFFGKTREKPRGMAACLINLEDTIRMAEWLPYHYATLPLGSVVIALDPHNSDRGIQRTLELIDLWKDKVEITLWPDFFLPQSKRFREKQSYTRERQVYFANQCLAYHRQQNRTWTLLTDNDEYFIFNYVHDDESLKFDHPSVGKRKIKNMIKDSRKKFMPLRKDLPMQNESTILDFINEKEMQFRVKNSSKNKQKTTETHFFPSCIRMPGIKYGGDVGVNETSVVSQIIETRFLSTFRNIHHERRQSKFSKVMIDVSRAKSADFNWTKDNHAKTIHNPSRICGFNGASDSGADYFSSLFRLNHYLGSLESYLERATDYRKRSAETYKEKAGKLKPSESNSDTDIWSWMDVFVQSVGGAIEAKKLLAPLVAYQEAIHRQQST